MSQPIKTSDELILDARRIAEVADRSIAGQIEPFLEGSGAPDPRRAGAIVPLSECLASVDTAAGRRRVAEYIESRPFPHYEPVAGSPGLLVRIKADGTRTTGRFVGREFRAVS
jgi:hypothetical protein